MILVDKNIKDLVANGELIIEGYDKSNVNCISYDLTIGCILIPTEDEIDGNIDVEEVDEYTLKPNEYIMIKTIEKLKLPPNILGRIADKNSVMRMGISVAGPHYQPGHETYSFLKIYNQSYTKVKLKKGFKIAQIIFEELKEEPEVPYNLNNRASFNNEITYKGYGKYKDKYAKNIERFENIQKNIENKESTIYSNILTFMGIFVSIFSLLTINFQSLIEKNRTA